MQDPGYTGYKRFRVQHHLFFHPASCILDPGLAYATLLKDMGIAAETFKLTLAFGSRKFLYSPSESFQIHCF
ncbi:MAG: hypothetical protein CVU64_04900 [Deltaproteobacteria bacterium HGW-Deltaproteobacteria-21]|nr:MAG: hypothetical protein CVU64_04900 [Deltaproteobacteria bacterium HGW-Deltaproteobacteria-21]